MKGEEEGEARHVEDARGRERYSRYASVNDASFVSIVSYIKNESGTLLEWK